MPYGHNPQFLELLYTPFVATIDTCFQIESNILGIWRVQFTFNLAYCTYVTSFDTHTHNLSASERNADQVKRTDQSTG